MESIGSRVQLVELVQGFIEFDLFKGSTVFLFPGSNGSISFLRVQIE